MSLDNINPEKKAELQSVLEDLQGKPSDETPEETPETAAEAVAETAPEDVTEAAEEISETAAQTVEAVSETVTEDVSETVAEDVAEAVDEAAEDAAETAAAETPAEEPVPGQEVPLEAEVPVKKKSPLVPVLAVIAGLLLIAVVCLTIVVTTMSRDGSAPNLIQAIRQKINPAKPDSVAMEVVDNETGETVAALTNRQLAFYYWGEFYYHIQSYGLSFDATAPLAEQAYDETMSWHDYFLQGASDSLAQTEALKAQAAQDGFVMPQEFQEQYDSTLESLAEYAQSAGYTDAEGAGDVLAYVQDSYGPDATVEDFQQFLYDSYYVSAYSNQLYEDLSFTEEEIGEYYDAHSEDFLTYYGIVKSDTPDVNVRHILIQPGDVELPEDATDEDREAAQAQAMEQAKAEAERIYQEWQDGDATEDSFAELANTYSTDPGSNTSGGLYEDVYPGQMVDTFDAWCFDPARKVGDTGIVETSYGYHIMYFSGVTDHYHWMDAAESELRYERANEQMESITARYSTVPTDKLSLPAPSSLAEIQAEFDAQQATGDSAYTGEDATVPAGSAAEEPAPAGSAAEEPAPADSAAEDAAPAGSAAENAAPADSAAEDAAG